MFFWAIVCHILIVTYMPKFRTEVDEILSKRCSKDAQMIDLSFKATSL